MKVARRILGVATLAMMVGVCSFAQLTKGFRGKVLDLEGKGVAGITVTLEDLGNPTKATSISEPGAQYNEPRRRKRAPG